MSRGGTSSGGRVFDWGSRDDGPVSASSEEEIVGSASILKEVQMLSHKPNALRGDVEC